MLQATVANCNIGCMQFPLYHLLQLSLHVWYFACIGLQGKTPYFCYYAIVETVVRGWLVCVCCVCIHADNVCTSIGMYDCIYICECTALMSPNRAKQPYMQTGYSQVYSCLQQYDLALHVIKSYWPMKWLFCCRVL